MPLFSELTEGLLEGISSTKRGAKSKSDFETKHTSKYRIAQSEDDSPDNSDVVDDTEESEFEGFSDSDPSEQPPAAVVPSGKYIPPAARKTQPFLLSTPEQDPRLQKQIQGILNRYIIPYLYS